MLKKRVSYRTKPASLLPGIFSVLASYLMLSPLAAQADTNSVSVPQNPPPIKMQVVRHMGQHKGYSVDVRYPQFTGGSKTEIRKLNRVVKRTVDMNITPQTGPNYSFSSDFEKSLVTSRFASLKFEFSNYFGGITSENNDVTLNAQIYPKFKILKLKDILGRKVNYSELSRIFIVALKAELKAEGHDLTDPIHLDPDDFSNFTFDNRGLSFILPAGAIAQYADQQPSATVTYKKLKRLTGTRSLIRQQLNSK